MSETVFVSESIETCEVPMNPSAEPPMTSAPQPDQPSTPQPSKEFLESVENLSTKKEKVEHSLKSMSQALAEDPPQFKEFWEVRKFCLPLFKELEDIEAKKQLWSELQELTGEARRRKDILIQEGNFAQEQIEKAILSLEEELAEVRDVTKRASLNLPKSLFPSHHAFYETSQGELQRLNAFASRINALRKELMKTNMRIKSKNELFSRLSKVGDLVFPERKRLIQEVSDTFVQDVTSYHQETKEIQRIKKKLVDIRDEIKELQRIAKHLTLNTYAFNATRKFLSELWDNVKQAERERKKEILQSKQENAEFIQEIQQEAVSAKETLASGEQTLRQAETALSELQKKCKQRKIDRSQSKHVQDALSPLKEAIHLEAERLAEARQREEKQKEEERLAKIEEGQTRLHALEELVEKEEIATIEETIRNEKALFFALPLHKSEKMQAERFIKKIHDRLLERKEEALLHLSDDAKEALSTLSAVLESRLERRKEIKERLEQLRRRQGSFGLDFEQALLVDQEIQEEKTSLKELDQKIQDLEQQINQIKHC